MGAKVSSFQNDTSALYGFLSVTAAATGGQTDRNLCIDKSVATCRVVSFQILTLYHYGRSHLKL